jgi:acetoacetyl-CoA synthetase
MKARSPLWVPSRERIEHSRMYEFMDRVVDKFGIRSDWETLRQWSVTEFESFWAEMLDYAGIESKSPASATRTGEGMLDSKWFPGMTFNYAEHLLRFDDDHPAIEFETESGASGTYSYRELKKEVARFAAGLRREGVSAGDRVAGFLPNIPETVIAMLAASSIGAIWSSCSPDFGTNGVLDRFGQIEPVVLVSVDGYFYNGKRIDITDRISAIIEKLPSLKRVVLANYPGEYSQAAIAALRGATTWGEFCRANEPAPEISFEPLAFDHPLFIMYSSGTTGVPKCIVHGQGGTLLQHMKEHMLHGDLRRDDVIFYFTTCGWMMWNWLVGALGVGATIALYEGSPTLPSINRLWKMAERLKCSAFGTSPKFIAGCQNARSTPGASFDLSSLRCILSTGSPLSAEQFEWVYANVKEDLQLSSISGGTDIISCFMLGNPILPVYAGEIQCRGLGMDVLAYDESGKQVTEEKGELVCATPFPSQPICFWNDQDHAKYKSAYFDHYEGIWRHGDFIEITDRGGVIVYGRSDATLNPGGVRIGTAEIDRIVEAMDDVTDCIVVGKQADNDVEVALFVVLRDGVGLTADLVKTIKEQISAGASKRHVPKHIKQVTEIPRTISGKKVELAVTRMIHGQDVANKDALANPGALEQFREIV